MPVHSSAMSTPSAFQGSLDGIALGGNLDLAVAEVDRVAVDGHGAGEAAMHGVEAQQMGVGLDRAEIVDADHLDILAAGSRRWLASTLRPMRPNPLIATRIAMLVSPLIAGAVPAETVHGGAYGGTPGSAGRERSRWRIYVVLFPSNLNRQPKRFRAALTAASAVIPKCL